MNRWLIKILTLIGCLLMLPSTLVTASPKNKTKAPKIVVETDPVEIIKTDAKQSYVRLIKAVKPYRANSGVRIYYVKITDQGLLYGTKKKTVATCKQHHWNGVVSRRWQNKYGGFY